MVDCYNFICGYLRWQHTSNRNNDILVVLVVLPSKLSLNDPEDRHTLTVSHCTGQQEKFHMASSKIQAIAYLALKCCHFVPPSAFLQTSNLDPDVQLGAQHPNIIAADVSSWKTEGWRAGAIPKSVPSPHYTTISHSSSMQWNNLGQDTVIGLWPRKSASQGRYHPDFKVLITLLHPLYKTQQIGIIL